MDNLKICEVCKLSKNKTDFIGDQNECYKCVYARKVKNIDKTVSAKKCKLCKNFVPSARWTYCGTECATEAKKRHKHWTINCKGDTKNWKKRFNSFTKAQRIIENDKRKKEERLKEY